MCWGLPRAFSLPRSVPPHAAHKLPTINIWFASSVRRVRCFEHRSCSRGVPPRIITHISLLTTEWWAFLKNRVCARLLIVNIRDTRAHLMWTHTYLNIIGWRGGWPLQRPQGVGIGPKPVQHRSTHMIHSIILAYCTARFAFLWHTRPPPTNIRTRIFREENPVRVHILSHYLSKSICACRARTLSIYFVNDYYDYDDVCGVWSFQQLAHKSTHIAWDQCARECIWNF